MSIITLKNSYGVWRLLFAASLLYCAVGATQGNAVTIEGVIVKEDATQIRFKDENGLEHIFGIKSFKRQTQEDLNHLESGDYLFGQGSVLLGKKLVVLEDIEIVGIQKLLGRWREGTKDKIFEFSDFNSLTVQDASDQGAGDQEKGESKIKYRLMPNKKDSWTVFLSEKASLRVGSITHKDKSIKLQVMDLETGSVAETFDLSDATTLKEK